MSEYNRRRDNMFVVGECCWNKRPLKILKVGGGDELTINRQQNITETTLGLLARVENEERKTILIFNLGGYILLSGYCHKSKTAGILYSARTIPYGIPGSRPPRAAVVRKYPQMEPLLRTRTDLLRLPITGRLILAFCNEIPIGDFGTQEFPRNCWMLTPRQKDELRYKLH